MHKVIIAIIVVLVALPVVVNLLPEPMSFERVHDGFEAAGFTISAAGLVESPRLEAAEQFNMTLDGARVELFRYNDRGRIARQFGYQQQDPGEAMVESMGLREALGAAPTPKVKTSAARRGLFMILVSSADADVRARVIRTFKEL